MNTHYAIHSRRRRAPASAEIGESRPFLTSRIALSLCADSSAASKGDADDLLLSHARCCDHYQRGHHWARGRAHGAAPAVGGGAESVSRTYYYTARGPGCYRLL